MKVLPSEKMSLISHSRGYTKSWKQSTVSEDLDYELAKGAKGDGSSEGSLGTVKNGFFYSSRFATKSIFPVAGWLMKILIKKMQPKDFISMYIYIGKVVKILYVQKA